MEFKLLLFTLCLLVISTKVLMLFDQGQEDTINVHFEEILNIMSNFNETTLDLLIEKFGIDWTYKNGESLLCVAIQNRQPRVAKELITHHPHLINIPNKDGEYPLNLASQKGFCELVLLLLENGAQATSVEEYPDEIPLDFQPIVSALLMSYRFGQRHCVRVLLIYSGKGDLKDKKGNTAFDEDVFFFWFDILSISESLSRDEEGAKTALGMVKEVEQKEQQRRARIRLLYEEAEKKEHINTEL